MGNQFQGITSGLAELKNYYQGPIVDLLNEELKVYRAAEKVKHGWSGFQVVRPLRVRRNQGIGATSDGGILPAIGRQTTVQATITSAFNYLRFGVTGPMIKASQSDVGSFVRSAAYELEMGYKDLRSDENRQLQWNGNGNLATFSAGASASTSITIAGRESTETALKFVDIGLVFDIVDQSTLLVKQTGVTVLGITTGTGSSATAVITLDQPVTANAADWIVRSQSYNQEMQGLLYALDGGTTTINGVDRSKYISFQGNVTDNAAAQLTLNALQGVFNEGLRRGGVGKYNAVWTSFAGLQYYQKLLTPDKRYSNTTEGDGTFGDKGNFYLNFNGIPIVPDKDSPTRFFMLPAEVLKMYVLCEMEFADETGSMYIAQSEADTLEVRIRHFAQLFNEQPAACAVLKNFTSP